MLIGVGLLMVFAWSDAVKPYGKVVECGGVPQRSCPLVPDHLNSIWLVKSHGSVTPCMMTMILKASEWLLLGVML